MKLAAAATLRDRASSTGGDASAATACLYGQCRLAGDRADGIGCGDREGNAIVSQRRRQG
jgi:hypothetical protein